MFKTFAMAAILTGATAVAADAALVYPTSVLDHDQNGTVVAASRSNPDAALSNGPDGNFYSLGIGGSLTLDFGRLVTGEGLITEVTYNTTNYYEYANLYTSRDGVTWTTLALAFNADAVDGESLFSDTAFRYLKLVDASEGGRKRDGFDIDSVGFTPVPLPAAGFALLAGLGSLAAMRRRRG